MSYYPTLAEDVARAKQILARGKADLQDLPADEALQSIIDRHSGTIYGADIYAAYKLLESFVEVIETVGPGVCEVAMRAVAKGRELREPDAQQRVPHQPPDRRPPD